MRDQFGASIVEAFDTLTDLTQPFVAEIVAIIEAFEQSTGETRAFLKSQMKGFPLKFFVGVSNTSHSRRIVQHGFSFQRFSLAQHGIQELG
jgi:hypothetical protein